MSFWNMLAIFFACVLAACIMPFWFIYHWVKYSGNWIAKIFKKGSKNRMVSHE